MGKPLDIVPKRPVLLKRRSLLRAGLLGVPFAAGLHIGLPVNALLAADTQHIELYSGLLEVDLPTEFEELRLTEMEKTFPSLPIPDYVYADRLRTSLIAVSIVNNPNPQVDLLTYTATWAKALEASLPEFNWVQRRVARIEGRPWIVWQYHCLTPDGLSKKVTSETIMFMSILSKDVMVLVLGHAPRAIFAQRSESFQAAVTSLNLSIDAPQLSGIQALNK